MEEKGHLETAQAEALRGNCATELRVVLLGKTGNGKSSLGNTLLGQDTFTVARGMCSGTDRCQFAHTCRMGSHVQVTDTPGVCDTHRSEVEVLKEVGKSLVMASPGPHVILMVLRCDRRFTKEEYDAYLSLKGLFGEDICRHMMVVFVGLDCLGATEKERDAHLKQEVTNCPPLLRNVIDDAGGRYFGVDNMASQADRNKQADLLLGHIQTLVTVNAGNYFSSQLCQDINTHVQQNVRQLMKEDDVTYDEALMRTKDNVIQEKPRSLGFLKKLVDTVGNYVLPILKKVVGVAASAGVYCNLM